MRSSNPALSDKRIGYFDDDSAYADNSVMTVTGTAMKTLIAVVVTFAVAVVAFAQTMDGPPQVGLIIGCAIGGLVIALVTIFKPTVAPYTTLVYAVVEGYVLGAISAFVQQSLQVRQGITEPIAIQACLLTMGVLAIMLFLYQSRLIRVTGRLKTGIIAATGAIALLYLISIVMSFTGLGSIGFIHSAGPIGIGFSLFVVGLAAFNLLLDFDLIERLSERQAPKYMEWYGAFALLMTLIWLYMELLRLLSKLNRR